jgi:hypothetical protein
VEEVRCLKRASWTVYLSSIATADFADVTDTETAPAEVQFDCEADFHMNITWTHEDTKQCWFSGRYTDGNDNLVVNDTGNGNLYVYETVGGDLSALATYAGVLSDGVAAEVDFVVEGTSASVFLDKVLLGTVTHTGDADVANGYTNNQLVSNDIVLSTHPYPALGGNTFGATDRVVCPQVNDTFSHTPDFLAVERTIIAGASGSDVKFRIEDASNYMQRTVAAAGATHKLYKVVATVASALINGGAVDADDDITAILDGADGEILEDGASQGTTSGALFAGNASGSVAYAPEAIGDALELWPLYVYPPFTIPGL